MSDDAAVPKVFQPSTMASRRAEREARGIPDRPPRRLVSCGWRTMFFAPLGRDGEWQQQRVELVFDADDTAARYYRVEPGGALHPYVTRTVEPDRFVARQTVPIRSRPSRNWPAGQPDPPATSPATYDEAAFDD